MRANISSLWNNKKNIFTCSKDSDIYNNQFYRIYFQFTILPCLLLAAIAANCTNNNNYQKKLLKLVI